MGNRLRMDTLQVEMLKGSHAGFRLTWDQTP